MLISLITFDQEAPGDPQPAQAELGSNDAMTAVGDAKDDAGSGPPRAAPDAVVETPCSSAEQKPPRKEASPTTAAAAPSADPEEPTAPDDVGPVPSSEGGSLAEGGVAVPTVSDKATAKSADSFSFGSALAAKSSGTGFGGLAGEITRCNHFPP